MTIVSETKHVQVFKFNTKLNRMKLMKLKFNTKLNRMKLMSFRLYPMTGPVPEAPVASSPAGIESILFDWPCLK